MGWKISKQFNFAYGHRVHRQVLRGEFALDRQCVCRHLHGHEAEVHVHLVSNNLDPQGMVTDFLHLSWLKKFFDETVDHRFIVDINDPLFDKLVGRKKTSQLENVFVPETDYIAGQRFHQPYLDANYKEAEREYYESFFVVDFIPTSENLSKWVYDLVTPKMARIGVAVGEVEWWETPKSCSRYTGKN